MPVGSTATRTPVNDPAALPTPVAGRLQRPSWRDGRLLAGVLLVVLAMIAGALTLRHFDDSVTVLQASRTLEPGDQLRTGDVVAVGVRLQTPGRYLTAVPTDARGQVLREVRAGELIPSSAVGDASSLSVRTIAVPVSQTSAATLQRGAVVDVWVSARKAETTGATSYDPPIRLLEGVPVSGVPAGDSGLGGGVGDAAVQLLIPQTDVPRLLGAMNGGGKVDLVPVTAGPPA